MSSWKALLIVIPAVNAKEVLHACCQAILEEIAVDELPLLFHELITVHLLSKESKARSNTAFFISYICSSYRSVLTELLSRSESDGELERFYSLDYQSLLCNDEQALLCGSANEKRCSGLYSKSWLERQRKELKRILKSSCGEASILYSHPQCNFLTQEDEILGNFPSVSNLSDNKHQLSSDLILPVINVTTSETWFARLTRFLITSLVDKRWEVREGSALGLNSIISSLTSSDQQSQSDLHKVNADKHMSRLLPAFLLEDIACMGVMALIMDRVVEFEELQSKVSSHVEDEHVVLPVKAVLASMVVSVVELLTSCTAAKEKIMNIMLDLMQCQHHWTVSYGGVLLLDCLIEAIGAVVMQAHYFERILQAITGISSHMESLPIELCNIFIKVFRKLVSLCCQEQASSQVGMHCLAFADALLNACKDEVNDANLIRFRLSMNMQTLKLLPYCHDIHARCHTALAIITYTASCLRSLAIINRVMLFDNFLLVHDLCEGFLVIESMNLPVQCADDLKCISALLLVSSTAPGKSISAPAFDDAYDHNISLDSCPKECKTSLMMHFHFRVYSKQQRLDALCQQLACQLGNLLSQAFPNELADAIFDISRALFHVDNSSFLSVEFSHDRVLGMWAVSMWSYLLANIQSSSINAVTIYSRLWEFLHTELMNAYRRIQMSDQAGSSAAAVPAKKRRRVMAVRASSSSSTYSQGRQEIATRHKDHVVFINILVLLLNLPPSSGHDLRECLFLDLSGSNVDQLIQSLLQQLFQFNEAYLTRDLYSVVAMLLQCPHDIFHQLQSITQLLLTQLASAAFSSKSSFASNILQLVGSLPLKNR
jgi:hypothetical protein